MRGGQDVRRQLERRRACEKKKLAPLSDRNNSDLFEFSLRTTKECKMSDQSSKNQGEGNYKAAKQYDEESAKFAKSGKVEPAAKAAKEALDGPEREELEKAEIAGKSHAKK
jgi:hypothetical protein